MSNSIALKTTDIQSIVKLFDLNNIRIFNCNYCNSLKWPSIKEFVLKMTRLIELCILSIPLSYTDVDNISLNLTQLVKFEFTYPQKELNRNFNVKNNTVEEISIDMSLFLDDPTIEIVESFIKLRRLVILTRGKGRVQRFNLQLSSTIEDYLVLQDNILFDTLACLSLTNSLKTYLICGIDKNLDDIPTNELFNLNITYLELKIPNIYKLGLNKTIQNINGNKLRVFKIKSDESMPSDKIISGLDSTQFSNLITLDLRSIHVHSTQCFSESLSKLTFLRELHLPCCALHIHKDETSNEISFKRAFDEDDDNDIKPQFKQTFIPNLNYLAKLSITEFSLNGMKYNSTRKEYFK